MEESSYTDIGALLRLAREDTHLSLEEVSRRLHIRARYLDALEHGNFSELPGVAYTKGYLQAYAAFLDLDKDEIIRRFEQIEGEIARRNFYFPQVLSKEKTPSKGIIWGSLAAALLMYLLGAVALAPERAAVSIVDIPPQKRPVLESILFMGDVPCLRFQNVLYPPCHVTPLRLPFLWKGWDLAPSAGPSAIPEEPAEMPEEDLPWLENREESREDAISEDIAVEDIVD